jgi:hypothetical protein
VYENHLILSIEPDGKKRKFEEMNKKNRYSNDEGVTVLFFVYWREGP